MTNLKFLDRFVIVVLLVVTMEANVDGLVSSAILYTIAGTWLWLPILFGDDNE